MSVKMLCAIWLLAMSTIAGLCVLEARHVRLDLHMRSRSYSTHGLIQDTQVQLQYAGDAYRDARTRPLVRTL